MGQPSKGESRAFAHDSEQALLEAARTGDRQAFRTLWHRHAPPALNYIRRFAYADAEDVIAEAFTEIWDQLQRGIGPTKNFGGYLYATARNIAAKTYREHQRTLTNLEFEGESTPPPIERVLHAENADDIISAFKNLPERWQEVLWLTEVEGLGRGEVAKQLGLKPNAVSALSKRAIEGLRINWLRQQLPDDDSAHRAIIDALPRYVRGTLPRSEHQSVRAHLADCESCSALHATLLDQEGRLGGKKKVIVGMFITAATVPAATLTQPEAAQAAGTAAGTGGSPEVAASAAGGGSVPAGGSTAASPVTHVAGLHHLLTHKVALAFVYPAALLLVGIGAIMALTAPAEPGPQESAPTAPADHDQAPDRTDERGLVQKPADRDETAAAVPDPAPQPSTLPSARADLGGLPMIDAAPGELFPDETDDAHPQPAEEPQPTDPPFTMLASESYGGAIAPVLSGDAPPELPITVRVHGETVNTLAAEDGSWQVDLAELDLPAGPLQAIATSELDGETYSERHDFTLLVPQASALLSADPATVAPNRLLNLRFSVMEASAPGGIGVCVHTPDPMTWRFWLNTSGGYETTYYGWQHETLQLSYCRGDRLGATIELVPEVP